MFGYLIMSLVSIPFFVQNWNKNTMYWLNLTVLERFLFPTKNVNAYKNIVVVSRVASLPLHKRPVLNTKSFQTRPISKYHLNESTQCKLTVTDIGIVLPKARRRLSQCKVKVNAELHSMLKCIMVWTSPICLIWSWN